MIRSASVRPLVKSLWTREEQVQEFVDVIPDLSKAKPEVPKSDSKRWAALDTELLAQLHFIKHFVSFTCVYPILFFLVIVVLTFEAVPYELWKLYYWMLMTGVALGFACCMRQFSFQVAPSYAEVASVWLAVNVAIAFPMLAGMSTCGTIETYVDLGGVLFAIYEPSMQQFFKEAYNRRPVSAAVYHFLSMSCGALPCALSVALYGLYRYSGWSERLDFVVLGVAVWTLAPLALKPVGSKIISLGAPFQKAIAPIIWVYYTEVCFSCLGLGIFMHSAAGAILFAASFGVTLGLTILRGTQRGYSCLPIMSSLTLHRVVLLFEAFSALVGRASSYMLYVCFAILNMAMDQNRDEYTQRYSLVDGKKVPAVMHINIYSTVLDKAMGPWIGLAGMAVVISMFVAFTWLLPQCWHAPVSRIAPADLEPKQMEVESEAATLGRVFNEDTRPDSLAEAGLASGTRRAGGQGDGKRQSCSSASTDASCSTPSAPLRAVAWANQDTSGVRTGSANRSSDYAAEEQSDAGKHDGHDGEDSSDEHISPGHDASSQYKWPGRGETKQSWIGDASSAGSQLRHFQLLHKFIVDYSPVLTWSLIFVFTLCATLVSLAESVQRQIVGEDSSC